jgi:hypothetical protein
MGASVVKGRAYLTRALWVVGLGLRCWLVLWLFLVARRFVASGGGVKLESPQPAMRR